MNIATEVNKEVLGAIGAEAIAKIDPNSPNGKRWISAIAKLQPRSKRTRT
ncbi:MAG TPA: hypothetical protein VF556_04790 [Pyrinomonadaceae bacterium]